MGESGPGNGTENARIADGNARITTASLSDEQRLGKYLAALIMATFLHRFDQRAQEVRELSFGSS
jgi:hypothetical protein